LHYAGASPYRRLAERSPPTGEEPFDQKIMRQGGMTGWYVDAEVVQFSHCAVEQYHNFPNAIFPCFSLGAFILHSASFGD
jgi:hypothetical protein